MSESKKVLVKIQPKNEPEQFAEMLKEFDAVEELEGKTVLSVPESHTVITDEGHLIIVLPSRLDFAIALESDEFVILTKQ